MPRREWECRERHVADEIGMKQKRREKAHNQNPIQRGWLRTISGGVKSEMRSSLRKMQRTIKGIINVCLE